MNPTLLAEIRILIAEARNQAAATVNAELTLLYWKIGNLINAEILQGQRADYGKQVIATLSRQLTEEYGRGGICGTCIIAYGWRRYFLTGQFCTHCVHNSVGRTCVC